MKLGDLVRFAQALKEQYPDINLDTITLALREPCSVGDDELTELVLPEVLFDTEILDCRDRFVSHDVVVTLVKEPYIPDDLEPDPQYDEEFPGDWI